MAERHESTFVGVLKETAGPVVVGATVAIAIVALMRFGQFERLELTAYDQLVDWRQQAPLPESPVTLLWITEEDIRQLGHPLTDLAVAELLDTLLHHSPRAIGLDLYRDRPIHPGSERLERFFVGHDNVFIVEKLADSSETAVPAPAFARPGQVGFADVPLDADGIVRRMFLMMWDADERAYLSFGLVLALHYLKDDDVTLGPAPRNDAYVALGSTTLAPLGSNFGGYANIDAGGYQILLDQRRNLAAIPRFSVADLSNGAVPDSAIRDRVVVVATASPSVKDAFFTSYDRPVYGGELHAWITDQLIRHAHGTHLPIRSMSSTQEISWLVFWCLVSAAAGRFIRNPALVAATAAGAIITISATALLALTNGFWIPIVAPGIGAIAAFSLAIAQRSRREHIEKMQMKQLFGQFVSKKIVSKIWNERDIFMDGGRPRPDRAEITVMQTDLRGFTSAAAMLDPAVVMEWIGRYMEAMAELVERHGGVINDFVGDGLMANFGVPIIRRHDDHIKADAQNAVACGQAMAQSLTQLNAAWCEQGLPTARMRIGIASGPAVVGAYGSRERLKYTSVGTVVNTAARLESYDKDSFENEGTGSRILVTGSTWDLLDDAFEGRSLGSVQLRGLSTPVRIFRIPTNEKGVGDGSDNVATRLSADPDIVQGSSERRRSKNSS